MFPGMGEGDKNEIKNKFNREALNERFCVALSSLAGNVGQVVSVESLLSFLGTAKDKDLDLQQIKSSAERCGFTITTNSYSRGLKELKLSEREATILLLNTPNGVDFVYVYCPAEQKEQPSMDDLMNQMGGGDGTGEIPEGEEAPEMFDDDEVGEGANTPKDLNDLYWSGQAPTDSVGFTFSKFAFKQVFDVGGYILKETKDGFVNIVRALIFPVDFVKGRYSSWSDFWRHSIKTACINYIKKSDDKSKQGIFYKLFFMLHWLFTPIAKFILTNIGETSQKIMTPDMITSLRFAGLTDEDIENLNKYKYYRVSNGVLCEVKSDSTRLNKIFSSIAITAEKLAPIQNDSYSSILRRISKRHWLWSLVQKQKPIYMRLIMATAIVNMFAVIGSLYTMTVYDRVVPNNAIETLWTLSIGMVVMHIFDYILKLSRTVLTDKAGSNIDLSASQALFNQLVGVRMQYLKGSTGHVSTIMRDFTTVSEFFTSATLLTLVELPFFFIYLFVMAQINVNVMLVLLAVALIVIILGLSTLPMLNSAVKEATVDGHERQGVLVEAIGALETIKGTGGTRLMNQRFHEITVASTYSNKRVKFLSQVITYTMGFLQQLSSIGVVVIGVYAIATQSMTMGGLIACSILLGRAMAPVTQFASILTRIHQVRSSMSSLDGFMMTPTERESHRRLLSVKKLDGHIEVRNVSFKYETQEGDDVLTNVNLKIAPGEKIAILGRIGSGKSTLIKAMFGINIPTAGHILYNGIDYRQIESSDLRAKIGYVAQDPVLISGTILENLTMGNPYATDKEIIDVCKALGIDKIVSQQKDGYNQKLREKGVGLSVGQRQLFAIAQTLLKKPDVIFMDEPTSSLDDFAVRAVREALSQLDNETTLVLVAHSQAILAVVDRLIILEDGKLIADGPKDEIIQAINDGKISPR